MSSEPSATGAVRSLRRRPAALLALGVVVTAAATGAALGIRAALEPAAPPEPSVTALAPTGDGAAAFPVPGTTVVHPRAQLAFRGVDPAVVAGAEVVGSVSGTHRGEVLEHPDGGGASLVPDEPFAEGEQLTVRLGVPVAGADDGTWTLGVARLAERPEAREPPVTDVEDAEPGGDLVVEHVRTFASAPDLEPPRVDVAGPEAGTTGPGGSSPGYTLLGVKNGFGHKGPLLLDDAGEPVWFLPLDGVDARDVRVQTYRDEPVLTWWEGRQARGYGWGEGVVVDASYREVARVQMAGYEADSHEMLLTDAGTALLIAYEPVRLDLTAVGGPADGVVVDNVVQEVDVATGAVLLEWHGVGQVALDESYLDVEDGEAFDYLHLNSVDLDADGDLLVSARHTCAVYSIDRATGTVEWRLGGRESDVALPADAVFLKQHDARRADDGTLTVLDNGGTCGDTVREVSRGIALDVDEEAGTARVVREVHHPDGVFTESQANFQELDDGTAFLGWGSVPRATLVGPDGEVLLDLTIPDALSVTTYRAYRVAWTGRPLTDPSAVVVDGPGGPAVHVSWNGATEVASWRVVDAAGATVVEGPRDGFETVLPLPGAGADLRTGLAVEALDDDGEVLGSGEVAG
ncbi:arylsulfotransferase family protein [Cellulomonas carbonis]|uniref:ArsR family transcriptional regulator n=1 Tax=Cellulomonas carbonis T26 TaxID=947969 RepID=A0A0A0BV50_9CELL|nr:arylsulfotransferase family protein [Cellulomonas carbonis]KGM11781.1 ArsR family transcriptional regulator [Cellulomonas carbonis T26]GGC09093.1 hypothetical protein GCM10010972_23020 [Cellulomonas carbonis]